MKFKHLAVSLSLPLAFYSGTAQAGFFEFLFQGNSRPPMESQAPIEMQEPGADIFSGYQAPQRQRRVEAPHRRITLAHKGKPDQTADLGNNADPILHDHTLREGDAVMTKDGLRVFTGSRGKSHQADEFAKVEETKGLSPTEKTAMVQVDAPHTNVVSQPNVVSQAEVTPPVVTGRSSATDGIPNWKWVRDPKGEMIRYVGP